MIHFQAHCIKLITSFLPHFIYCYQLSVSVDIAVIDLLTLVLLLHALPLLFKSPEWCRNEAVPGGLLVTQYQVGKVTSYMEKSNNSLVQDL